MSYPKIYCSKHGIARVHKHIDTTYDTVTGIPRWHWVEYRCPNYWGHFFGSDLIERKLIDTPEWTSYYGKMIAGAMIEEGKR